MAANNLERLRALARNVARSRDIALAIQHKVPVVMAEIGHIMRAGAALVDEDLMIASGDFSPSNIEVDNFCTLFARFFIADALADYAISGGKTLSSDQRTAFVLANLSGVALNRPSKTNLEVQQARQRLISKLRLSPPNAQQISQCLDAIIRECHGANAGILIPSEQAEVVVPGLTQNDQVCVQRYIFYTNFAHLVPADLLEQEGAKEVWRTLSDPLGEHLVIDINVWNSTISQEQLTATWSTAPPDVIIGIYNMMGSVRRTVAINAMYASILAYVTTITKPSITDAWLAKRMGMLTAPGFKLELDNFVSVPIFEEYKSLLDTTNNDLQEFYNKLMVIMTLARRQGLDACRWIVEQSALANITHATTIALVCKKLKYFDVDVLIDVGVPETDVVKFLQLALEVMRCPFRTIIDIPVKVAEYSTLAYICLLLAVKYLKEASMRNYAGNTIGNCILSKGDMENIARMYYEILAALSVKDLTTLNLLNKARSDDESEIVEIGDGYYTSGGVVRFGIGDAEARNRCIQQGRHLLQSTNPPPAGDCGLSILGSTAAQRATPGTSGEREEVDKRDEDRRAQLAAKRVGWAKSAMALPSGSIKLSPDQIASRISGSLSHRAFAFKEICGHLYMISKQTEYTPVAADALNCPTPYRQITDDQEAMFKLWGINVPNEYKQAVEDYVSDHANEVGVSENRYLVLPKPTPNMIVRDANDDIIEPLI